MLKSVIAKEIANPPPRTSTNRLTTNPSVNVVKRTVWRRNTSRLSVIRTVRK